MYFSSPEPMLRGELKGYEGIRRLSIRPSVHPSVVRREHFQSTTLKPFIFLIYHLYVGGGTKSCAFCSNRIGILVFMATYSSRRLIMGKEEIDNFFCLSRDIWIFLQKCLFSIPLRFILLFSKLLNLIGCRGSKRVNFRKNVEKSSQKP